MLSDSADGLEAALGESNQLIDSSIRLKERAATASGALKIALQNEIKAVQDLALAQIDDLIVRRAKTEAELRDRLGADRLPSPQTALLAEELSRLDSTLLGLSEIGPEVAEKIAGILGTIGRAPSILDPFQKSARDTAEALKELTDAADDLGGGGGDNGVSRDASTVRDVLSSIDQDIGLTRDLLDALGSGGIDAFETLQAHQEDAARATDLAERALKDYEKATKDSSKSVDDFLGPAKELVGLQRRLKDELDVANDFQQLRQAIDPVTAAQDRLTAAELRMAEAFALFKTPAEEQARLLGLLRQQAEDAIDPIGRLKRELSEELSLARLLAGEREIEGRVRDLRDDLMGQGFSREQAASAAESFREQLTQIREVQDQTRRMNALLRQVRDRGPDGLDHRRRIGRLSRRVDHRRRCSQR